MNAPEKLKYTKNDEWFDEGNGAMGLTDFAQDQLSDIVFVELLVEVGDTISAGDTIASVESVKASAEVYAAAAGTITEINDSLADTPEVLNSDPYNNGWIVKVENGKPGEVMDATAYKTFCEGREH